MTAELARLARADGGICKGCEAEELHQLIAALVGTEQTLSSPVERQQICEGARKGAPIRPVRDTEKAVLREDICAEVVVRLATYHSVPVDVPPPQMPPTTSGVSRTRARVHVDFSSIC